MTRHTAQIPHDDITRGLYDALDILRELEQEKIDAANDMIGHEGYEEILSTMDVLIDVKLFIRNEIKKRL